MYKINVLMSTYNGEKYLREQIVSIMLQENVFTTLTIRDDGSEDGTIRIIKELMREYPDRIRLCRGKNVGYKRSFTKLLSYAEPADFYAFSDQDDHWMPEKLAKAVEMIEESGSADEVVLYASSDIVTDENLNQTGIHDVSDMPVSIEGFYSRARIAGCTYCFTPKCLELSSRFAGIRFPEGAVPDHDFILGSVALSCGKLLVDGNAYIYHRRTSRSATSGGNGVMQRVRVEADLVFGRRGVQSSVARASLKLLDEEMNPEAKEFLTTVAGYKKGGRMKLLTDKRMRSGVRFGDLETKIKIILGNY